MDSLLQEQKNNLLSDRQDEQKINLLSAHQEEQKNNLLSAPQEEQKNNLLSAAARQEEQMKKGLSTEKVVEQRKVRQKRTTSLKKTQKKMSQKRQFESLPRLDHKHNAGSTKLADIYNLDEPVLYQASSYFKSRRPYRSCR